MYNISPIILFVYKRPEHTKKVVEALLSNTLAAQSDLYIYADGAAKPEDRDSVEKVRAYIKTIAGFKKITIAESDANKGLATSVLQGIQTVFDVHDRAIILEDDTVVSSVFLEFMNTALETYKDKQQVGHVSGYMYGNGIEHAQEDGVFIRLSNAWGWGTWKRVWKGFNPSVEGFQKDKHSIIEKGLRNMWKFNGEGHYDFFGLLEQEEKSGMSSWAIRWYAYLYANNYLTFFPTKSLVKNIGFDGSGTHKVVLTKKYPDDASDVHVVGNWRFPKKIETTEAIYMNEFYKQLSKYMQTHSFKSRLVVFYKTLRSWLTYHNI